MNIKLEQIQLRGNRILVKQDPAIAHEIVGVGGLITASGKSIDGMGRLEKAQDPPTGVIVAVGPDVKTLQIGDRVLYSPHAGAELEFMLEMYLLMSEPEPVMVIKN